MTLKLDKRDKRLIYELWLDGRQSLSALGKKTGLSVEAVNYRINRLVKKDVIKFQTYVDYTMLGYPMFYILFKFGKFSKQEQKKVIGLLHSIPEFYYVVTSHGSWDIVTAVIAKNIHKLDRIINRIFKETDCLADYLVLHAIREYKYTTIPVGLLDEVIDKKEVSGSERIYDMDFLDKVSETGVKQFDKLDKDILDIMADKGRVHLTDVAKQLNVSSDTIKYRIKRMMKDKIILGFIIHLNKKAIGYTGHLILVNVSSFTYDTEAKLKSFIEMNDVVTYASKCTGNYNFAIECFTRNLEEFDRFLLELREFLGPNLKDMEDITYFEHPDFTFSAKILDEE